MEVDVSSILQRLGISAKRRAREWFALCPNREHKDHTPSWRIRDEPGSKRHAKFHCYPCGFKGDAIDLVMYVLDCPWGEARAWLGGGETEVTRPVASGVSVQLQPVTRRFVLPMGVEFVPLDDWPASARRYAESRGITAKQVRRWGIGYAVAGKLAGRIVFVKRTAYQVSSTGREMRIAGYSARTFIDDSRRYVEPESKENARSFVMFGEEHWPLPAPYRKGSLYVVEGAINALAVERAIPGAYVAVTSGSQLHPMHAAKIACWGEVVLVTDPDPAGDKLAAMISATMMRHEVHTRRATLRKGEDAASLHEAELKEALER